MIDEWGRTCRKCEQYKIWDDYHKHSECVNGRNTICKECRQIESKEAWAPHRKQKEGDLYMVECLGYYKIGIAIDVKERISNMQTGNPFPIRLVKTWPGRADLEREVHEMLDQYHHRGEWFKGGTCEL